MVIQERLYSSEELWTISHLPANTGRYFELVEGLIYEMAPTGWMHGDYASELDMRLRRFVKDNKLGRVTAAETGYILHKAEHPGEKDTVLAPDVGFVAASRIPDNLPDGYVPFAPDLAVEVISPGNTQEEINFKIELYLRYGTRMIWVFYPRERRTHVYTPGEIANQANVVFLGIDDTLDGGAVLPGFSLSLREFFEGD
jgi:Uma2 family endonuclease